MSKVTTIKKALRIEALLKDSFKDTPEVDISVHAIGDRAVHVHASYAGTLDYQVYVDDPTYTAEHDSTGWLVRDLYNAALHPLDHWVDVQVQMDKAAQEGRL